MLRKMKVYRLSDGTRITPRQLAEKLNCSVPSARARLKRSKSPEVVFRPVKLPPEIGTHTKIPLSNGSFATPYEMSVEYDIHITTVISRVKAGYRDIESLSKKTPKKKPEKKWHMNLALTKDIGNRNYFDEMSRLLLKTI